MDAFLPKLSRNWIRSLLVVCTLAVLPSFSAEPPDELSKAELEAELAMEEEELPNLYPVWDHSLNVRSWGGYKDNVLLANRFRDGSPFAGLGLDLMLFFIPTEKDEFSFFVSGDYIRYFSAEEVDKESDIISQLRYKHSFPDDWRLLLDFDYFYYDQVFDVSDLDRQFPPLKLELHDFAFTPAIRKGFLEHFWTQLELELERQEFQTITFDSWNYGPEVSAGWNYQGESELSVHSSYNRRDYDDRSQKNALGTTLAGTRLSLDQYELSTVWRHYWDQPQHWRTTTKGGVQLTLDQNSGYYDYWRYHLSEQLRYRLAAWEITGDAGLYLYDYTTQPLSTVDLTVRRRANLNFALAIQRTFFEKLRLFSKYEHERSLSNDATEEYYVNSISAGVDWEF